MLGFCTKKIKALIKRSPQVSARPLLFVARPIFLAFQHQIAPVSPDFMNFFPGEAM
jgi:hypothetical protein